jgi:hypothetical protein
VKNRFQSLAFKFNLYRYIKAVNVVDCFSLNGRPPQHLFDSRVNLLPYTVGLHKLNPV